MLNCFGKKKKTVKVQPPSREAVNTRTSTTSNKSVAPPIPVRERPPAELPPEATSPRYMLLQSPKAEDSSNGNTGNTSTTVTSTTEPLSKDILTTPVPVRSKSEHDITNGTQHDSFASENSQSHDYLLPDSGVKPPTSSVTPRRQLPEEIIASYMIHPPVSAQDSIPKTTPVLPPRTPSIEQSDYTNVSQIFLHQSATSNGIPSNNNRLGVETVEHETVSRSSSALSTESSKELKSPHKPPIPIPRPRVSDSDSTSYGVHRDNSISSDTPDFQGNAFDYENMAEVITNKQVTLGNQESLSDLSRSNMPRPSPRRSVPDIQLDHEFNTRMRKTSDNDAYVCQKSTPALHSSGCLSPQPTSPLSKTQPSSNNSTPAQSPLLGRRYQKAVDLNVTIPKGKDHGGTSKGYTPMDRHPKTMALQNSSSPRSDHGLNVKVPLIKAGNINDVHVPGYITVLPDATSPKTSAPYYNLDAKPSAKNQYANVLEQKPFKPTANGTVPD